MEQAIMEQVTKLYHSFLLTAALDLALIVVVWLVMIGVIKFKLIGNKTLQVLLIVGIAVCSVLLMVMQAIEIMPVYQDYKEQSYIVAEQTTMTVKDGSSGGIHSTNRVVLLVDGQEMELKMRTDYSLTAEQEYVGTVAYLEHCGYVVWYSFD